MFTLQGFYTSARKKKLNSRFAFRFLTSLFLSFNKQENKCFETIRLPSLVVATEGERRQGFEKNFDLVVCISTRKLTSGVCAILK